MKWQVRDLILHGNADVIKGCGFSENRKMAAIAHASDRTIMTHNTRPYLAIAASLLLVASIHQCCAGAGIRRQKARAEIRPFV